MTASTTASNASTARLAPSGDEILLDGPHYLDVFAELHRRLRPRTYFEVGTWTGSSLKVATCKSLAVDVDFQLEEGVVGSKPVCIFHQSTSDDFFASQDPASILGGRVDLAFIDALHVFEYALRDFIGTERSVHPRSMIVLDDPCPRDFFMARRQLVPDVEVPTKYPGYWTGDVWKLIPVIRQYRPDIELVVIDTLPTGLVIATNLDPANRALEEHYDEIVAEWRDVRLEDYGMARILDDMQMIAAARWVAGVAPLYPDDPLPNPRPKARGQTQAEINRDLTLQLEALRRSKSWQVTRPLRWLGALARRASRRD